MRRFIQWSLFSQFFNRMSEKRTPVEAQVVQKLLPKDCLAAAGPQVRPRLAKNSVKTACPGVAQRS